MRSPHTATKAGFSTLELLVSVAIFVVITSVVVVSQSRLSGSVLITNLAYDLALSVRQAQTYGISVRASESTGEFNTGYGVRFGRDDLTAFLMFADTFLTGTADGNKQCDGAGDADTIASCSAGVEFVKSFKIERGNRILKFCGVLPADTFTRLSDPDSRKNEECNVNSLPVSNPVINYLDLVFTRPDPDAFFKTEENAATVERYKGARIYVTSPRGVIKIVEVTKTGQISIK